MYGLLYIVVIIFVTLLFIWAPLFPFYKAWKRLRDYHPDIWAAKGPFDIRTLTAYPASVSGFLEIVSLADRDETLTKKDPELIKWTRAAREVWKMAPRGFLSQIGYAFVFIWFVLLFSSLIMGLFG